MSAALLALLLIIYEMIEIASGHLYQEALGGVDGTTLVELGLLTLWGMYSLKHQTDLQAVSFTLVAGLSFIFLYEAIYKWSFYRVPFDENRPMAAAEVREFVIQVGIAASILTGFASRFFTLKKWTLIWLGLFAALWVFWMSVGFPQITGESFYQPVIPSHFTREMTYLLNRATKSVLFLAYLTLFPPLLKTRSESTPNEGEMQQ